MRDYMQSFSIIEILGLCFRLGELYQIIEKYINDGVKSEHYNTSVIAFITVIEAIKEAREPLIEVLNSPEFLCIRDALDKRYDEN